jgi:hypothetical protein
MDSSEYRIKLRHRARLPTPWKWEIHRDRLITASHESYKTQTEAHTAGRKALRELLEKERR